MAGFARSISSGMQSPALKRRGGGFCLAVALAAGVACLGGPSASQAQDYPSRAVRLVVPFAPGAGSDITGRLVAEALSARLGQSVFVDNKPGAGSAIGVDLVAKSKPDGYTVLWTASDGLAIGPALKPDLPYKLDDFAYISRVTGFPFIIAINSKLPYKTLAELVAHAKANPGAVRYGTAGIGSGPHLATELLARATGVTMEHIPYQGIAPALAAVLGGVIELAFGAPSAIKPYHEAGSLRVLAVAGAERHPLFPDVPTTGEAGFPNVETSVWWGLVTPAAVPRDIVDKLRNVTAEIVADPKVAARLQELGYQPNPLPGEQFKAFVVNDVARWKDVAAAAKISIQ